MILQYYFLLCLCLTICLSRISVYCCICLGSFSMGESYDLKIINTYKQRRNKLRGLAYYLGLRAMLTWLLGLSGLELSRICLLWSGDGDNRQLYASVHADTLWVWQHHFGSQSTRLEHSSLPKLESTPCWNTNSAGYNTLLPFSDLILKLSFWFDKFISCSLDTPDTEQNIPASQFCRIGLRMVWTIFLLW